MEKNELLKKLSEVMGKPEEEIWKEAEEKSKEMNGMVSPEGALMIFAQEKGVDTKPAVKEDVDKIEDVEIEEISSSTDTNTGATTDHGQELTLDDLSKKYIKNPGVDEEIEMVLKKIFKSKEIEGVDKDGKKFSTALSNVDYKMIYLTSNDEEYSPKSWEVVGKVNAICRKLKKIDGVELKIKHIYDGRIEKEKDCYSVSAKVDGVYKELDRKTNEWKII